VSGRLSARRLVTGLREWRERIITCCLVDQKRWSELRDDTFINNNNNNNNIIIIIIYLTANGLSPGGSGYNACI
jgi:hypothetical protein